MSGLFNRYPKSGGAVTVSIFLGTFSVIGLLLHSVRYGARKTCWQVFGPDADWHSTASGEVICETAEGLEATDRMLSPGLIESLNNLIQIAPWWLLTIVSAVFITGIVGAGYIITKERIL